MCIRDSAWDARGHGRSPGERGDSPSFAALVKDVDRFVRHVSDCYAIAANQIAVVGQSVGAVLAATWAHDYAPQIRCLVLTAPAFQVKLYVPPVSYTHLDVYKRQVMPLR